MLDAGEGARLERFGSLVVDRPYPGATAPRRDPDAWEAADLRYHRWVGWSTRDGDAVPGGWTVDLDGLTLLLRPTETGQIGLFPEHGSALPWLVQQIRARGPAASVLHLFAYTGLVTLALARAGSHVAHVDASRPAVTWARRNAAANGLADRPVRWLVEDVRRFVDREVRRGRRYEGVVLDPPSYGHGGAGVPAWRIERDLPPLLERTQHLLAPDGFVSLTAHSDGITAADLGDLLRGVVEHAGTVSTTDLEVTGRSGARLTLGVTARWDGRA